MGFMVMVKKRYLHVGRVLLYVHSRVAAVGGDFVFWMDAWSWS